MLPSIESPNRPSSKESGVKASEGSMVSSKRGGYWEPGEETKLSARLLAGECSNLIIGADIANYRNGVVLYCGF